MMEIFRILDELEIMVKEGKKVPLSGKTMIEPNLFLDRLDRIRAILPEELEHAQLIIEEKEKIKREAYTQAQEYIRESETRASRLLDENEITKNAMQIADEIVAKAEKIADEIRRDADEYAEGVLTHMEIVLRKGLEAVLQGKEELKNNPGK